VSPDGARVAFQLDRFEQMGDDRLEVAGRWYGVRGLRFVRPALTVQTKDGERNLLALLEHKPWAAEEGESWVAAFPWEGESPDPEQTELAVAPSVVVTLADEDAAGTARGGRPGSRRSASARADEAEMRARRLESEVAWLREEREALLEDKRRAKELESDLAEAREAAEGLTAERDAAARERDDAVKAREQAVQAADAARRRAHEIQAERDQALAARESAIAEFEQSVRDCTEAVRERDRAIAERDSVAAERDEALAAGKRAFAERDAALGRGSGFPAVSAADLTRQPHSPAPPPATGSTAPMARAIAAVALVVLLLLVILFLKLL
jgi:hypothetical protein